jgi:thiosulfate/3-mercaptopyruvate sulfurtransferase
MNPHRFSVLALAAALSGVAALMVWGDVPADPWTANEMLAPKALADELRGDAAKPVVIAVAFPVLYRQRHITGALFAGPGRDAAGIEALKAAVKDLPKNTAIVLYCGCCPMVRCPNIRPSYRALKELGYTNVRVLDLATNFHDDWTSKGYPSEPPI